MPLFIFQHEGFEYKDDSLLSAELNKEITRQIGSSVEELASLGGEVVKPSKTEIQYMLKELGFLSGKIDGVLGKETGEAVKAFQRKNELPVDGILGDETLGMLQMLYGEFLANQEGAYTWDDGKRGEIGMPKNNLAVPDYAEKVTGRHVNTKIIEQKYGIKVSVEHRSLFTQEAPLDLEYKLQQLDSIFKEMSLTDRDKQLLHIYFTPEKKIKIKGPISKAPFDKTCLKLCIPYSYSEGQIKNAIVMFLSKARLAYDVLPHGYTNRQYDVDYLAFLKDPAMDLAVQVQSQWLTPVKNVYLNEVKLWVARSLYLSGEKNVTKENVEKHLQSIIAIRKEYAPVSLFYQRNIAILAGDQNLHDKDNSNPISFFNEQKEKLFLNQSPNSLSVMAINEIKEAKEQFKEKFIETPPPATFYIIAHGNSNGVQLEGSKSSYIGVSREEFISWSKERYKKFPELLNARTNDQDIILISACESHSFSRNIHNDLIKMYGNRNFPIIISNGEYGQFTWSSTDNNDNRPYWRELRVLLEQNEKVTIGDVMALDQWSNGPNSISVYTPLGKDVREKLKEKGLPAAGTKQIAETLYEEVEDGSGRT